MLARNRLALVAVHVLALSLGANEAFAQRINSYGAVDAAPKAASAPAASPGAGAAPAAGAAGQTAAASPESYVVKIYDGGKASAPAQAAPEVDTPKEWPKMYRGIIPGQRDEISHLRDARRSGTAARKPNQLTWVGFVPGDNTTRVFVQGARTPEFNVVREGNALIVTISNARIPTRNFSRSIDASFFERAVQRIETRQTKRDVQVRIELREGQDPTISGENGYVYFDFPYSAPRPVAKVD